MKRFYIIYIFLLLPLLMYAQHSNKAKEILDKTATSLEKAKGIRATFKGTSTGTLIMLEEKFHLNSEGIQTWYDGKTQWSYIEENEEVNISTPTLSELTYINPYLLFKSYTNGYDYIYKGEDYKYEKKGHVIKLIPKQSNETNITIFITENYIPLSLKIEQENQKAFEIIVSSIQLNQNYTDDTFRFNNKMYPNTEIIDLR